ncbi:hypothetical protein GCM10009642_55730 [Nocardiopsis metallicus]
METVRAALADAHRIRRLRAFVELWPESALDRAAEVDARVADGARLPLAGVPLAVKAAEGTASHQAQRLIAAGAVPIGATSVPGPGTRWKTWGHTDEGPTLNPWRADRVPGGSSAGSAVAVATGVVPLATASDGAGSTRIPAAWCGVLGYKPTTGLLPARDRAGLTVGGPIARTVSDLELYRSTVLGGASAAAPAQVRVAWSPALGFNRPDPEVVAVAERALRHWARTCDVTLSEPGLALTDPAESWLSRRDQDSPASRPDVDGDSISALAELFAAADLLATPALRAGRGDGRGLDLAVQPHRPPGPEPSRGAHPGRSARRAAPGRAAPRGRPAPGRGPIRRTSAPVPAREPPRRWGSRVGAVASEADSPPRPRVPRSRRKPCDGAAPDTETDGMDAEETQVMARTGQFTTTVTWETSVRGRVAAAIDRFSGPLTDLAERDANDGDTRMLVADFFSVGLNFSKFQDLTTEYRTSGDSIDYAIILEGELFAPIEVRRIGQDLDLRNIQMARRLAVDEGADWVFLTNGRVWRVYHLRPDPGGGAPQPVTVVDVDLLDEEAYERNVDGLFHLDPRVRGARPAGRAAPLARGGRARPAGRGPAQRRGRGGGPRSAAGRLRAPGAPR